jgi:hypothetical protein
MPIVWNIFDPTLRSFLLPIVSILLTLVFKVASRRDGHAGVTRNDLAVGFNLIIAGCVVLLNILFRAIDVQNITKKDVTSYDQKAIVSIALLLASYLIIAAVLSLIVRFYGWQRQNPSSLHWLFGILIPDLVGALMLVNAANYHI